MNLGNHHLRATAQLVDSDTPLTRQSMKELTTIVVDTPALIRDTYRYGSAWSAIMSEQAVIAAAAKALNAATTLVPQAIRACLPPVESVTHAPIATDTHPLIRASWHHGGEYETYWFGDVTTMLHYAHITDTEREELDLHARKAIASGCLAYAVGVSMTAAMPATPSACITEIGLLLVTPTLHPGTIAAVKEITERGLNLMYISPDDTYTVTAIGQLVGIAAKNETAITLTMGRIKLMDSTLYAGATAAMIKRLIAQRPTGSTIIANAPLVTLWRTLSHLVD